MITTHNRTMSQVMNIITGLSLPVHSVVAKPVQLLLACSCPCSSSFVVLSFFRSFCQPNSHHRQFVHRQCVHCLCLLTRCPVLVVGSFDLPWQPTLFVRAAPLHNIVTEHFFLSLTEHRTRHAGRQPWFRLIFVISGFFVVPFFGVLLPHHFNKQKKKQVADLEENEFFKDFLCGLKKLELARCNSRRR